MATYTGPVRAHVLRKHQALRRSRRKGTREKRLPPDSTTDKEISSQCPVNGNDDNMTLINGTHPPRTTLNFFQQGTADPFQAFARPITNFERFLIEKYLNHDYPWSGKNKPKARFIPARDLFLNINISDPVTMDVMISYGANSLANGNGSANLQNMARELDCKAIRALVEGLQIKDQTPTISLIVAVTGAICTVLETAIGTVDYLMESPLIRVHVEGLQNLIKKSGGWDSIKYKSNPAAWLIIWVDIHLSGMILKDLTKPLESAPEVVHSILEQSLSVAAPSTDSMELIHMYNQFYLAANFRCCYPQAACQKALVLEPIWLFQPLSIVYPILRRNEMSRVSRLVPLIFINLLIHNTQNLPAAHKSALYHLYRQNLDDVGIELLPTSEQLMWALMTDTRKLVITDIPTLECTVRLKHATTKLPPKEQIRLADTLCDFILLFQEKAVIGRRSWWTPGEFREILHAPKVTSAEYLQS